eukprot:3762038-Pyramimonas_sp.AAC.1
MRGAVGFLLLTRAIGGAAGLVRTGVHSQTLDVSVCRIQMSELGLILEQDSRNYLYGSSDLERCCRFSH